MSRVLASILLASLLLVAPGPAPAAQYSLQVASLIDDAFVHFLNRDIGRGEGEMRLAALERALDSAGMSRGGLLYDRDIYPAGPGVAASFGAVAVRPTRYSSSEEKGFWKTIEWEGTPGERVVWVVRPASNHHAQASRLGLSGTTPDLRYYLPYGVSLSPTPQRAVAYSLTFLRSGENGADLWSRHLSRNVDLREGLAAVVGVNSVGGDWVYLVVQQPPDPVVFRVAVGWDRRGAGDRVFPGPGGFFRL